MTDLSSWTAYFQDFGQPIFRILDNFSMVSSSPLP